MSAAEKPEGEVSLQELLMADWISLHRQIPELHRDRMLPLAARVYSAASDISAMKGQMPTREAVEWDDQRVAVCGPPVASASFVEVFVEVRTGGRQGGLRSHISKLGIAKLAPS